MSARLVVQRNTLSLAVLAFLAIACATPAAAQPARPKSPAAPKTPAATPVISVRGFADLAMTTFTAKDSFEATVGSSSGGIYGGGGEVVYKDRFGINVRFSHYSDRGERAFVYNGQRFGLGIPMKVTIEPLMVGFDYRFYFGKSALRPYAGFGIGRYSYKETSDFAETGEDVSFSSTAYEVKGGVEVPIIRWIRVAGEARWVSVPNAIGDSGVSADFGEDNLGGFNVAARILVGR